VVKQFDVCRNPSKRGIDERPYLVIVQSDLLLETRTRVCVPLARDHALKVIPRLMPTVEIEGNKLLFVALELSIFPLSVLGPALANIEEQRYYLLNAIDRLLTGN
jgi:hypothetical protein